jgi:hypothetical protein
MLQEAHLLRPPVFPTDDAPSLVSAIDFATDIPSDFIIEVLAEIMYKTVDLLGDEETTKRLHNLTFIGSSHAKKLASYEAHFFIVLGKHDKFLPLTEFMSDRHIPSKSTRRYFVIMAT